MIAGGCVNYFLIGFLFILNSLTLASSHRAKVAPRRYYCENASCELYNPFLESNRPQQRQERVKLYSQSTCQLFCGNGSIWPYPNGKILVEEKISRINLDSFEFEMEFEANIKLVDLFQEMNSNFLTTLQYLVRNKLSSASGMKTIRVKAEITNLSTYQITLHEDESYSLFVNEGDDSNILVTIHSQTIFGYRHALETLSQLIAWDDIESTLVIVSEVIIENDSPKFPYRGVMLDLSRRFLSVNSIKSIINAMGYNKMNVLHLHISDTASFPVELPLQPNISYYGAYSDEELYSLSQLSEIESFANSRGVVIIPEIDGPAHVAAGFQWGEEAGIGKLAICTDPDGSADSDWTLSGLGPPTGQINLGNEHIYRVLEDIFSDLASAFKHRSIFHVGGDEIMVGSDEAWASCYNSSEKAVDILNYLNEKGLSRNDAESFYSLWQNYTVRVAALLDKVYFPVDEKSRKLIIWGGAGVDETGVTYNLMIRDDVVTYFPPSRYTIEVWDTSTDSLTPTLLAKGYDVVLANSDYVYLDCGNAGWAHPGGYWCSPYHEWQHIYNYIEDVSTKWQLSKSQQQKILGSETLLWSEMMDQTNIIQKMWPRTAALAEDLWGRASIQGDSWYSADPRFQNWRKLLNIRGIAAEPTQTQWCELRGSYACTVNSGTPQ